MFWSSILDCHYGSSFRRFCFGGWGKNTSYHRQSAFMDTVWAFLYPSQLFASLNFNLYNLPCLQLDLCFLRCSLSEEYWVWIGVWAKKKEWFLEFLFLGFSSYSFSPISFTSLISEHFFYCTFFFRDDIDDFNFNGCYGNKIVMKNEKKWGIFWKYLFLWQINWSFIWCFLMFLTHCHNKRQKYMFTVVWNPHTSIGVKIKYRKIKQWVPALWLWGSRRTKRWCCGNRSRPPWWRSWWWRCWRSATRTWTLPAKSVQWNPRSLCSWVCSPLGFCGGHAEGRGNLCRSWFVRWTSSFPKVNMWHELNWRLFRSRLHHWAQFLRECSKQDHQFLLSAIFSKHCWNYFPLQELSSEANKLEWHYQQEHW